MSDSRPVGVFDSGMGGLSVLREIRRLLPGEDVLFCGDCGYAPYGERSQEAITARSLEICDFLVANGAKAIVIACNTATAAAAPALRAHLPQIPIIGMEPAVKPATAATHSGVVGVLATTGTLKSARFAALLDRFGRGIKVLVRPGVGLVEAVERGECNTPAMRELLQRHLEPMLLAGADVIVLGCTHYVFLRELIEELVGPAVTVIDTGMAVANQLQRKLEEADLLAVRQGRGTERFWASGQSIFTRQALIALWPGFIGYETLPASTCILPTACAVAV